MNTELLMENFLNFFLLEKLIIIMLLKHYSNKLLKSKNLLREIQFNGKNRIELFVTTGNFTINDSIEILKKIIVENFT
jgi:hypothetical protein